MDATSPSMALSMMAAKRMGIPFVVLDRPNPIGGEIVEGAPLDPKFKSFVGMYSIPARHGMTVGELATLFNTRFDIGANLVVIPAANWTRSMWFEETGLPWVNPSPNLRSPDALKNYPGTVYFEGTNAHGGTRHTAAIRTDRRAVVERGRNRARDEREAAAGDPLRADHHAGRADSRGSTRDTRFPPFASSSPTATDVPPGPHRADIDHRRGRGAGTPPDFKWTATIDRLAGVRPRCDSPSRPGPCRRCSTNGTGWPANFVVTCRVCCCTGRKAEGGNCLNARTRQSASDAELAQMVVQVLRGQSAPVLPGHSSHRCTARPLGG